MKCHVCGAILRATRTDLPFKTAEETIVILKGLPVLQCESCAEYLIEDAVMARVDETLVAVDAASELEVIRYTA